MTQQKDNLLNQGEAPESTGRPTLSALRGRHAEPSPAHGREPGHASPGDARGVRPCPHRATSDRHVGLGPSADGSDPAPLFSQQIRACSANSDVEEQWQLFPCEKMGSQTDVCFTRENLGTRFWKHFVRGRCEATVDTAHGLPPSGPKGWRRGAPWKPTRAWSGEPPGTAPWKCGPGTLNKGNWDAWLTRGCPPRARPALELGCGTGWNRRPRASAPRVQPSSGPARAPRPSGVPGHRAGRWCPGGSVTGPVCVPRPRSWACSL